jgi:hypothetical protein
MASFLRGKQAGMQTDLSANILPGLFAPDERNRYGINSKIGYVERNLLSCPAIRYSLLFEESSSQYRPEQLCGL